MPTNVRRWLLVAGVVSLLYAPEARAQASLQVPLEFDFLNPGARSLALGSAFVGLADDATAVFTNPAGLTNLVSPEFSIEGRGRELESRYLERGRLSGTLTNQGIDTVNGPVYGTSNTSTFGPGFLSFVYPWRRVAVAAFRHEVTSFDESFRTQGVFQYDQAAKTELRELALDASRKIDIVNYGGGVAVRANDQLSLGFGVTVGTIALDSTFTRYFTFPDKAAAQYLPSQAVFRGTQTADDTGVGFNAGVLWAPKRVFQVGLTYKKGPAFDFQQTLQDLPGGAVTVQPGTFRVPDTFAVGVALRPFEGGTLTSDYTYVKYSTLKDDYVDVQARPSGRQDQFQIDDANEFHVGFEFVFRNLKVPPALRVGYWYDPSHAVFYVPTSAHDTADERFSAYLPGSDNFSHFTFGGGIPFNKHFEINAGADFSDLRKFYSVLAVARF